MSEKHHSAPPDILKEGNVLEVLVRQVRRLAANEWLLGRIAARGAGQRRKGNVVVRDGPHGVGPGWLLHTPVRRPE